MKILTGFALLSLLFIVVATVDLTISKFDSSVKNVVTTSEMSLVLLHSGKVYKSENTTSWTQVNVTTKITQILTDNEDVLLVGNATMYRSTVCTNCSGWTDVKTGWTPLKITPHPENANWLLAVGETKDCSKLASDKTCFARAYKSKDLGLTWLTIDAEYVVKAYWQKSDYTNVIVQETAEKLGNWYQQRNFIVRLVAQGGSSKNPGKIIITDVLGADYDFDSKVLLVYKKNTDGTVSIHVSGVKYAAHRFEPADWLVANVTANIKPDNFKVIHPGKDFILGVYGDKGGEIFIGDYHFQKYYFLPMLQNVSCKASGSCRIIPMAGMKGVYAVNQVLDKETSTVLTTNGGGLWDKTKITGEGCFTTLHTACDCSYDGILTREDAPGIALANGKNTCPKEESDEMKTLISTENGVSWKTLFDYGSRFAMSRFGELIVASAAKNNSGIISWSWSRGADWRTVESPILVGASTSKILAIKETADYYQYVVYGTLKNGTGFTTFLNISTPSPCKMPPAWPVYMSIESDNCISGAHRYWKRRRNEEVCFTPIGQELNTLPPSLCKCEQHDYLCDTCFEMDGNRTCILNKSIPGCEHILQEPPALCNDTWTLHSGYVPAPRSDCSGGVKYSTEQVIVCPITPTTAPTFNLSTSCATALQLLNSSATFRSLQASYNASMEACIAEAPTTYSSSGTHNVHCKMSTKDYEKSCAGKESPIDATFCEQRFSINSFMDVRGHRESVTYDISTYICLPKACRGDQDEGLLKTYFIEKYKNENATAEAEQRTRHKAGID